jgi:hypothetical protein
MLDILKLNADVEVEQDKDSLGGSGPLPTDVYAAICEYMYLDQTASGALMAYGSFKAVDADRSVRFSECIMSKKSGTLKATYTDKRTGKEKPLPGYTKVLHLAQALGMDIQDLSGLEAEQKILKLWDYEQSKELPQEKNVITSFTGKPLQMAVMEVVETKMAKDAEGKYTVPTAEERSLNEIVKWFDANGVTNSGDKDFKEAWLLKNKGNVKDKRAKNAPKAGAPAAATSAPQLKFD